MLPSGKGLVSERVLIRAPYGKDGKLIQSELLAAGFAAAVCNSIDEVCLLTGDGAGAVLIGDEALDHVAIRQLAAQLANQPPWSDLPLLVMTSGGASTAASRDRARLTAPLANVTLLERPLRPATLVSTVRAALRARRRQYQLRDLLAQLSERNRELHCANRDLTRVNRELEEFAYVASHDLQEPLRMVNIYTHLLLREGASIEEAQRKQYGEFVQTGVKRMELLIRDLLTFSRTIQTEDAPSGAAELSVSLSEAMSVLRERIEQSGAVITAGDLPVVRGDAMQIAHIFQNLISNSIKYRKPAERPEIHVSASRADGHWVVAVRDNGIGFDQQYAKRIFGLFKRLYKDEYPGTGLGLAICQRIVEKYGGRIWATSQAGKGATFYFALPGAGS